MWAARARAATDVWLGWPATALNLDENEISLCNLSKISGRRLLTGRRAEAQTGHNNFVVKNGQSPRCFVTVTNEASAHLCVTLSSYICVHFSDARKKLLRKGVVMEEIGASPSFVVVGRRYVQQAGCEWRRGHRIRYHSYLTPDSHGLPNAVTFGNEDKIAFG